MSERIVLSELLSRGVLVQGITGQQGRIETKWMLDSGVKVVAGVTPGKGGETVCGVPVYNTVAEAVAHHQIGASMVYAPPRFAAAAAQEAVESGIRLVCLSAEGIPVHGMLKTAEIARKHEAIVVGPNSQGIVVPGVGRIGCPGGADPWERFAPGPVGVVTRTGGLGSDLSFLLRQWGFGTSAQIHIGGSPVPATPLVDAVLLAQAESATRVVAVLGEPTGSQEIDLAEAIGNGTITVPVVVLIPGTFVDRLPADLPFGHASRMGLGQGLSVAEKYEILRNNGAYVAQSLNEVRTQIEAALAT